MRINWETGLLSFRRITGVKYNTDDLEERAAHDERIHPQKRLLTPLILDKSIPPIPTEDERIAFPYKSTNMISELFYLWVVPLMKVGYKRTIVADDLYQIKKGTKYDVDVIADYFSRAFEVQKNKAELEYLQLKGLEDTIENRRFIRNDPNFEYPKNMLMWAVFLTCGWDYFLGVMFKAISDIASGLNTLLVHALIDYVYEKHSGKHVGGSGYGYAVGIAVIVFFVGSFSAQAFNRAGVVGGEVKGLLTKVLLDKSFRLSRRARIEYPHSSITSLMGNDVFKIDLAASYLPFALCLPIGLTITIALLAVRLGGASLAGVAYFILVSVGISFFTKTLVKWRKSVNVETDSRVLYIKEILNNMKMLKYYAWEIPFYNLVTKVRGDEMKMMLKIQFSRNIITGVAVTLPLVSAMIGFLSMYGQYHGLKSSSNIFSSVTLFNILILHISLFPLALNSSADALIAFRRIQEVMVAEEEEPDLEYHKLAYDTSKAALRVRNADFTWGFQDESNSSDDIVEKAPLISDKASLESAEKAVNTLSDINLEIKHGEFIVITGSIGSGKSSLLAAINGEMTRLAGSIDICGDLVLCSVPWIQNTTVRENIIFGLDFDRDVYNTVIECCALPSDFDILPAGDKTEIGERGVNLSGGQKARINLARTVYRAYVLSKQYNIVMFDDVLSAVDAKVGKHIMKECILGLLSDKTRILATHQLSLIGEADRIIYMNGDGTIDIGTNEELMGKNEGFRTLMAFQMEGEEEKHESDDEDDGEKTKMDDLKLIRKQTTRDENLGKTIQIEQVKSNSISGAMFVEYLRSGCGKLGIKFLIPNLFMAISLSVFCMLFENVWLSFWITDKFKRSDPFYIGIYVMVTCGFVLCSVWQFCTIIFITNKSSMLLNIKALKKIMHAPMSFFDTTPMGRIMNRFTKDTDVLDNEIAEQARLTCMSIGNVIGVLILCIIYMPWFAITIPLIVVAVVVMFSFYQATSREVKRIEGVQRSFVFSDFDEVLRGLTTIKLFSSSKRFLQKNSNNINKMNESYFLSICLMRWFAVSLHVISASINFVLGMLCVTDAYPISAAGSGLLISFSIQFSMQIITATRSLGQVEQQLSSVERICEYATELPQEASYENPEDDDLPKEWPVNGSITFKDVSLRYRPGLPFVLKNMSFDIKGGEKIGICGRTGAGKSTIMTALYRLSEIECGQMFIDGVDIQKLGLFKLRSNLAIIPQDPVLFRGTIRRNLDPFEQTEDSVLQNAINLACGSENSEKFSLDTFVEDGGVNFSLGERQVIALCRALIRQSKILILDEATSSVDYETDSRIQHTISNGFKGCTILCIAHRLRTILDYDRILVMDKGESVEFDTPKKLWAQNGIFRSMCDKSGIEESDFN